MVKRLVCSRKKERENITPLRKCVLYYHEDAYKLIFIDEVVWISQLLPLFLVLMGMGIERKRERCHCISAIREFPKGVDVKIHGFCNDTCTKEC